MKQSEATARIEEFAKSGETFLDLGNCGLHDESYELKMLAEFSQLKSLSLGTSYFNDANEEITSLNTGRQNNFSSIPHLLLPRLQELQIRNTGISFLKIAETMPALTLLDLSFNKIDRIENLEQFPALTELALHGNFISRIENLDSLNALETLHLTSNRITDIENLTGLSSLKYLMISDNGIMEIKNLELLSNLFELDLNRNQIKKIENLDALTNLFYLNLSGNKIAKIENLEKLISLSSLKLQNNIIEKIENLNNLKGLKHLTLDKNRISKIEQIEELTELDFLGLDDNLIDKIENLEAQHKVQNLYLSRNRIRVIENLKIMENLKVFHFAENEIQKIEPIIYFTVIERISCYGNPINDCPADIWQANDITQVKAYFEKNALKQVPQKRTTKIVPAPPKITKDVKLILLGNSNSGKTNLVNYLLTGTFTGDRNSTHGLNVIRWEPDKIRFPLLKDIRVSIWDFGGQEYYHDAYKLFLSANAVYVTLWDKETDNNFKQETKVSDIVKENLQHFEKKYWLDTVRFYGDNKDTAPLVLVQNKTDNQWTDKCRISQEMVDEYNLLECYHISLMEGCNPENEQQVRVLQNFEKDLEAVLVAAADKAETKEQWQIIRNEVLDIQQNPANKKNAFSSLIQEQTWIEISDFNKVCKKLTANSLTDNDLYTLPRWLNTCGVVVFFDNNIILSDKVFINPKKLSEKIYEVLNKDILTKNGEFLKDSIQGTESFKTTFIEATTGLELVFPVPKKQNLFIAPQYLPEQHAIEDLYKLASANAWQDSYWIKVPFFYYKKLLNQLILSYVTDATVDARYFWKHGIVFMKNKLRVLIKGLYPENKESDAVILIGVEDDTEGGNAKIVLQEEIFKFISKYGIKVKESAVVENIRPNEVITKAVARETTEDSTINLKFLNNLSLSYDNVNYVNYNRLKELSKSTEKFFFIENSVTRLSLFKFLQVLPFGSNITAPKKVFVSYSHQDIEWLKKLRTHLSGLKHSGIIEDWTDLDILAGDMWDKKIKESMEQADVFICLLSADFVASNYIWNVELKTIFENMKKKKTKVIFIHVESFDLESLKGSKITELFDGISIVDLEIIPKDEHGQLKAAALWDDKNLALTTIVKRIRESL